MGLGGGGIRRQRREAMSKPADSPPHHQTKMMWSARALPGRHSDCSSPARIFFAGDGHTHWHVRDLETSELIRLDNGSKVGTGAKRGFCFFDNTAYRLSLSGAPQSSVFTGCGSSGDLRVTMGISVGWGDAYYWNLPDQYIDITGLTAGRYRLIVTADAVDWFAESDEVNNGTWVDVQIKGNGAPNPMLSIKKRIASLASQPSWRLRLPLRRPWPGCPVMAARTARAARP